MSSCRAKSGYRFIKLHAIDSTHLFALRLLESGVVDRDVTIIAKLQTAGVGRCGRSWASRANNLFMSSIKRISDKGNELSLVVACALHETLSKRIGYNSASRLALHWPNDIYYKNKKLSGILIAAVNDWFVISIGVNIYSVSEIDTAVALKEIYPDLDVTPIKLLFEIEDGLALWLRKDFSEIKNYWMKYTQNVGESITIKNGQDVLSGIYKGIDDAGKLILTLDDKDVLISSGDMFEDMSKIKLKMV